VAERIRQVEQQLQAPAARHIVLPNESQRAIAPPAPPQVAQVAQTAAAQAALESRHQAISEALSGKINKELGHPRKF